ncbi:MAG: hypothetical protein LBP92_13220 [Deltaproteobacteria bacterium]|jgi:predicted  nucleic acid-binding Zn-ribbon protein|nr:hypothetical protein [Deltaproteobacteria bacterium]
MSDTDANLKSERPNQMPSSGQSADATYNDDGQAVRGRNDFFVGKHESDINHINSQLTMIQTDIDGLKSDMSGLKSDMAKLESGLKSDMAKLESGLKSDMAGLKTDMAKLESELKSDMAGLKTDMAKLESGLILSNTELQNSLNANMANLLKQFEVSLAKMDAGKIFHYSLSISIIVALMFLGISTWIK